ncbi:MAG: thiol reductase thioredoxin, partial [Planctomycetota bacterium]
GFAALGARGIPTFARYEGGRLVQKREGALPLPALRDFAA